MAQPHRPVVMQRRLLLLKWLMVFIPPVTVAVGHGLLTHAAGHSRPGHPVSNTELLLVTALVTGLALALGYLFVETLFGVLRRLQAEAVAREQDLLTMNAVMRERERLSRELHDGAAQLVAQVLLRLDTIRELVAADRPREAEAELERLHGVAGELYEDIGESIAGLRTDVTERGLVRTLRDYVDQFEERHRIPVSLRADDSADRFSPLAALQLFQLVQEALTNVRKHAGAHEATVTLIASGPGQLQVVIADDGRGFTPGSQGHDTARPLGLTSMRERVEALGGAFQVQSRPGAGTRVTATIPVPRVGREDGHAALATPAR
ncbi:MAG TPA: sensor histidine kinase [Thermomicrobiales bacterium]|nr:sensor histidine kinase [Thermomicrobiales bacterium]